jgi:hypothetical protein
MPLVNYDFRLLHEAARIFLSRPANSQPINLNSRNSHAHRDGLSIFAARPDAFV